MNMKVVSNHSASYIDDKICRQVLLKGNFSHKRMYGMSGWHKAAVPRQTQMLQFYTAAVINE